MTIIKNNEAETAPLAGQIDTDEARDALLGAFIGWLGGPDLDTPYSKATIRAYSRFACRFLAFAASIHLIDVSEASGPTIRAFVAEETKTASPSSRAQCISALDAFFDFCELEGLSEGNPVKKYRVEVKKGRRGGRAAQRLPAFLYPNEVDLLMDELFSRNHVNRVRDLALIGLLLDSGVRTDEITTLTIQDGIDVLQNGVLRVIGKGDKERIVRPLTNHTDHLRAYIEARRNDPDRPAGTASPLFQTRTGKTLTQASVYHLVSSTLRRAGITKPQSGGHLMRHTAATLMLASGMSLRRVQENLGHASLNTTQLYTHLIDVLPE